MAARRLRDRATAGDDDADAGSGSESWLRPQSVVFTLLAEHLLKRERAVFSGSFIEILGRLGIGEHATRSTLARMASRGLLARQRDGRKIYFAMTPRCRTILEGGRDRIWRDGAVNAARAERWTLLAFSLPEAWQRQRYELRVRLTWAGFGPLQPGVWLAPAEVDVSDVLAELELTQRAQVFHAAPAAPTDAASVIRETFDLATLAERYRGFLATWSDAQRTTTDDPLSLTLRLSTQWLRILRDDPRVPVRLLPDDWPAIEAQELFRGLHARHRRASEALARRLLDTISAPTAT